LIVPFLLFPLIFQLSSKSDNRLFRVFFYPFSTQRYTFLETYSQPIRCISRSKQSQRPTGSGRKVSPNPLACETPSSRKNSYGTINGSTCSLKREASREIQNQKQTVNQNQNQNLNQHQNGGLYKFDQSEKRPKIECKTPLMQKDANGSALVVKEIFVMANIISVLHRPL
jgi:hypothetical protein